MDMQRIETERLLLREWLPEDLAPFAAINRDPKVVKPITESETAARIEIMQQHFRQYGYGLFACLLKKTEELLGYVGLRVVDREKIRVEIEWLLSSHAWGKGYATEGAKAILKAGFERYGLQEIGAFAAPSNRRSFRVMEKIGMTYDRARDFYRPDIALDHPLRMYIPYHITKEQYEQYPR